MHSASSSQGKSNAAEGGFVGETFYMGAVRLWTWCSLPPRIRAYFEQLMRRRQVVRTFTFADHQGTVFQVVKSPAQLLQGVAPHDACAVLRAVDPRRRPSNINTLGELLPSLLREHLYGAWAASTVLIEAHSQSRDSWAELTAFIVVFGESWRGHLGGKMHSAQEVVLDNGFAEHSAIAQATPPQHRLHTGGRGCRLRWTGGEVSCRVAIQAAHSTSIMSHWFSNLVDVVQYLRFSGIRWSTLPLSRVVPQVSSKVHRLLSYALRAPGGDVGGVLAWENWKQEFKCMSHAAVAEFRRFFSRQTAALVYGLPTLDPPLARVVYWFVKASDYSFENAAKQFSDFASALPKSYIPKRALQSPVSPFDWAELANGAVYSNIYLVFSVQLDGEVKRVELPVQLRCRNLRNRSKHCVFETRPNVAGDVVRGASLAHSWGVGTTIGFFIDPVLCPKGLRKDQECRIYFAVDSPAVHTAVRYKEMCDKCVADRQLRMDSARDWWDAQSMCCAMCDRPLAATAGHALTCDTAGCECVFCMACGVSVRNGRVADGTLRQRWHVDD